MSCVLWALLIGFRGNSQGLGGFRAVVKPRTLNPNFGRRLGTGA